MPRSGPPERTQRVGSPAVCESITSISRNEFGSAVMDGFERTSCYVRSIQNELQSTSLGTSMRRSISAQTVNPTITLTINGNAVFVAEGTSVAAALLQAGVAAHESVSGEPRNPLCAMGVCMECCATVNDIKHVRTCQLIAQPGMRVATE